MADADLAASVASLGAAVDTAWVIVCATFVVMMQLGFAMLEAGTVRSKNTKNILLKNLLDACIGAVIWFSWGYGIAYDGGGSVETGEWRTS